MTHDRDTLEMNPLTLVIGVLASMFIGVILAHAAPFVNGTRPTDCLGFWEAEEKIHQEAKRRFMERQHQNPPAPARNLIGSFSRDPDTGEDQ